MKICTSCKKELPDEVLFCANCGAKVESEQSNTEQKDAEILFCLSCGNKIGSGYEFCPACGNRISQQMEVEKGNEEEVPAVGKIRKKVPYLLLVLAVILIAGVGVLCIIWSTGKDYTDRLFYVKNDRLYMMDGKENANMLSGKVLDKIDNGNINEYDEAEYDEDDYYEDEDYEYEDCEAEPYEVEDYVTAYKDEKRIVYPEDMRYSYDEDEENHVIQYSLYYRSLKDVNMEPVKIDSKIEDAYEVTEDGSRIFYKKAGDLYVYDFEKKEKIAKDVWQYELNNDGSKVVYSSASGLYCEENGTQKKLSDDLNEWFEVINDFSTIYYVNEDRKLYQASFDGNSKKIAENIIEEKTVADEPIIKVYDTGELYYIVNEEKQLKVKDYIVNDVAAGEVVEEPEYPELPEYPDWSDYDDEKAYEKACKKYNKAYEKWEESYAEYFAAYEAYETAASWNELNAEIEQAVFSVTDTVYYYYNGTESKEIGRVAGQNYNYIHCADNKPAYIFTNQNTVSIQPMKLSDYMGEDMTVEDITVNDLAAKLQNMFMTAAVDADYVLAFGGATQECPEMDMKTVQFSDDMDCITYLQDGDLVKIGIAEGKLQKEEIYDTDVLDFRYMNSAKNDIIYIKDYDSENQTAGLYKNKKMIDEISVMGAIGAFACVKIEDDAVYYYKDWDMTEGTLMVYNKDAVEMIASDVHSIDFEVIDGKSCLYYETNYEIMEDGQATYSVYCLENGKQIKMADDVHQYMILEDGSFYYLTDYDEKEDDADLYLYQKKQNTLVDTDVQALVDLDVVGE